MAVPTVGHPVKRAGDQEELEEETGGHRVPAPADPSRRYCWTISHHALTLLALAALACSRRAIAKDIQEYCQYETFEASCGPDEVILMTVARYGRMRIGRCVKTDFGFLGCYTDVLSLLDKRCSGRRMCKVHVVDPTFGNKKPCNQEFKNYLEASYECVKVITPTGTICRSAKRLKSPPSDAAISSLVTEETGCGLPNTPYILEVPPGQTINLTLLDFHVETPSERAGRLLPGGTEVQPLGCDVYTTLKEPRSGRAVDVCGGRERHNIIFLSRTNIVEVIIHNSMQNRHHFLLKYAVLGCPDMSPPAGTWVERHKDRITIVCNATQQVWQLRCQRNSWVGLLGNCSGRGEEEGDLGHMVFDVMSLPPAILIAIVAGIACLISFLILMMGVYYFKRKGQRRHRSSKPGTMMSMTCTAEDALGRVGGGGGGIVGSGGGGAGDSYQQQRETIYEARPQACTVCSREMTSLSSAGCDYAYMWDSPGSKPRRIKYDKLYSAGIYGPLSCKCMPVKLQELDIRDTSQCAAAAATATVTTTSADGGAPTTNSTAHVTFCDYDPDVVRTLDHRAGGGGGGGNGNGAGGGELAVSAELRTLGTFKDIPMERGDSLDGVLQFTA